MIGDRIKIHNEGQKYEMFEINGKWAQWSIDSVNKNGDVFIECCDGNNVSTLALSQNELKQVLEFLQKQFKQPKKD
jgi:hypothetical protein